MIVPALNEALNLPALLTRIDAALAGKQYEVIIVDDGSQDETRATCEILADQLPIRLIVRQEPVVAEPSHQPSQANKTTRNATARRVTIE